MSIFSRELVWVTTSKDSCEEMRIVVRYGAIRSQHYLRKLKYCTIKGCNYAERAGHCWYWLCMPNYLHNFRLHCYIVVTHAPKFMFFVSDSLPKCSIYLGNVCKQSLKLKPISACQEITSPYAIYWDVVRSSGKWWWLVMPWTRDSSRDHRWPHVWMLATPFDFMFSFFSNPKSLHLFSGFNFPSLHLNIYILTYMGLSINGVSQKWMVGKLPQYHGW